MEKKRRAVGTSAWAESIMEHPTLAETISIAQILVIHPQIANLFVRLRVDCIGCSLNRFCTIKDMSTAYKLDHDSVWDQILQEIE